MDAAEIAALLASELVVTVGTNGPRGFPHLMPLWFVVSGGGFSGSGSRPADFRIWGWTYAKSQKVRNLERDPRCTLQVEAGGGVYSELRGVMIEAECVVHRELDTVAGVGAELAERYGGAALDDGARAAIARQAAKRVALEFVPRRTASWDHRKLASGVH